MLTISTGIRDGRDRENITLTRLDKITIFLEKSLRKLFTPDCITILYLRGFYMINNLDLESTTQQAMH